MRMGVQWTGYRAMQHALGDRALDTGQRVPGAMYRVMEGVMRRSKEEFVPVLTGALKASGRVLEPQGTGDGKGWQVDAVYGGVAVDYALDQHETPWYHHPVGQWKYLEQPLMEATGTAAQVMAADLAWR